MLPRENGFLILGSQWQGSTHSGIGPAVQDYTGVELSRFRSGEYFLGNIMQNDAYRYRNS